MKRVMVLSLMLLVGILFARIAGGYPEPSRQMDDSIMNYGNIRLRTTNYGFLGSGDEFTPQYPSLEYPAGSGIDYLYQAAPWISAKKQRRNALGQKLYWLSNNPAETNYQLITQSSPEWTPDKIAVLDSLTSVGFEGDMDLFELLPAYNPLVTSNPDMQAMYNLYNTQDNVLESNFGYPSPRPFDVPDPSGTYCFTIPQAIAFDTPGFETHSAYYYDYCPFGTPGHREWGSASSQSTHVPLDVAVHQESFAWNLPYYDNMIITRYHVYNTSEVDTLYDIALSAYFDADVGPQSWGPEKASDDKSGYIQGAGYNFAYSYDADFDGGLSTGFVANKIYFPEFNGNGAAWYWRVGQGPSDDDPLNPNTSNLTPNEKYWLATGRNPNMNKFTTLCPTGIDEYEQPTANDTRFLNTLYGSQPTSSNPNPTGRIDILPGESITYYSIVFCAASIAELKELSLRAEVFINNDMDVGSIDDLTFNPILASITGQFPNTFAVNWISANNPDHFQVMFKALDAPATEWQIISAPGHIRNVNITDINPTIWYEVKIASIYIIGMEEVYLESETQLVNFEHISPIIDQVCSPTFSLNNYPNPFKPETTISFTLKEAGVASLSVYNIKGQLVKKLINSPLTPGVHSLVWDSKDDCNNLYGSGLYFLRLNCGNVTEVRKILILK